MCLCGDSQCPSCGLAQGTLEPEDERCVECGGDHAWWHEDHRCWLHAECVGPWIAGNAEYRSLLLGE